MPFSNPLVNVNIGTDLSVSTLAVSGTSALTGGATVGGNPVTARVATEVLTATSPAFTAETLIHSVTASLVSGKVYRVTLYVQMRSTVNTDRITARIREDSVIGTVLQDVSWEMPDTGINVPFRLEAEYTAAVTGSKTLVGTGARLSGTGTIVRNGGATQPTYLYVDLIR